MKYKMKLWVIAFAFIIFCIPVIWMIAGKYMDDENYENRSIAERPVFSLDTIEDYPAAYETYYNDHLPFRNQLIQLNSRIEYYIFQHSSNQSVIKGKDGWLFYNNLLDDNSVEAYKGMKLFTEEELNCISNNLVQTQKVLQEEGITFVLFIAPNKERIYMENMPDYYGDAAEIYPVKQLVDYLRENTDICVVYPYEELLEAKEKYDQRLYYRLDTHWNYIGAYVGTCALMEALGCDMPPLEELTVTETEPTICDLADMINLRKSLNRDADYVLAGYDTYHLVTDKHDMTGEYIYHCEGEGADKRKLFMLRDSFADAMDDFVASRFNSSYMIHYSNYSPLMVEYEKPDIFVYETVERRVRELLNFKIE